jgi:hypothetical protein
MLALMRVKLMQHAQSVLMKEQQLMLPGVSQFVQKDMSCCTVAM